MAFILYLKGTLNGPGSEGKEVGEGEKRLFEKKEKAERRRNFIKGRFLS